MPHAHPISDALSPEQWRSYGFLQSYRQISLRNFYDEVLELLCLMGASVRKSYGLRFCHYNSPCFPEYDIDRATCSWKRLFPPTVDYIGGNNEFMIDPDDIGTHPAFQRGVLSFQVDFVEGFMCQFDISYSNSSIGSRIEVEDLLSGPPRLLELKACTDVSMRLKDLTPITLPQMSAFYHFWKRAATALDGNLCCGGSVDAYPDYVRQSTQFCAFQFAEGLPRWGTLPLEEARMPLKVEIDNTKNAFFYIDKCEDNLNIRYPWPYPTGPQGTVWWDRDKFGSIIDPKSGGED